MAAAPPRHGRLCPAPTPRGQSPPARALPRPGRRPLAQWPRSAVPPRPPRPTSRRACPPPEPLPLLLPHSAPGTISPRPRHNRGRAVTAPARRTPRRRSAAARRAQCTPLPCPAPRVTQASPRPLLSLQKRHPDRPREAPPPERLAAPSPPPSTTRPWAALHSRPLPKLSAQPPLHHPTAAHGPTQRHPEPPEHRRPRCRRRRRPCSPWTARHRPPPSKPSLWVASPCATEAHRPDHAAPSPPEHRRRREPRRRRLCSNAGEPFPAVPHLNNTPTR